jgi:hypothetical protein
MKKVILSFLALSTLVFTSCSSDDDNNGVSVIKEVSEIDLEGIVVPQSYEFTRNGQTTVSYGGQTTRTLMAKELVSGMKDVTSTVALLKDDMFANGIGFSTAELNDSGKTLKSKFAASDDFFPSGSIEGREIQRDFDRMIEQQVTEVFVARVADVNAAPGTAGKIQDGTNSDGSPKYRYVNDKGVEYDQEFAKGLIGALQVDQALNNYMTRVVNDDNVAIVQGKNYTEMEHHFDEAYGYLMNEEDTAFFGKYLARVNGSESFDGIADDIDEAFRIARQAIVDRNDAVRDQAIEVLRYQVSKVIAVRTIYYLQAGKVALQNNDNGGAFHDLSEGFGFVKSLRFTRKSDSNAPIFSSDEVNGFVSSLTAGNGFWTVSPETLDSISEDIAAKFDFTVAQASI